MKCYYLFPFMALILFLCPASIAQASVQIGEAAPDFTLSDSDGNEHKLSDLLGRTVVLEWTNHECPYVIKHYDSGNMQSTQKQATDMGAVWLTIVSSAKGKQGYMTPEESRMLMEKQNTNANARLLDASGEVGKLYGAKTTPHMYIIDAAGTLVYAGAIDDNPSPRQSVIENSQNYVLAALENMENGDPVAVTQTKPYGCSVKYGGD